MVRIIVVLLITFSFAWNVMAAREPSRAVSIDLYAFCNVKGFCSTLISIRNKTPYIVKLVSSSFPIKNVASSVFQVFDAEKYIELEIKKRDVSASSISPQAQAGQKASNEIGEFMLKPLETKFIELEGINLNYKFDADKNYFIMVYMPFVSTYLNGEFVGTMSYSSNYSLLSFPSKYEELKN